MSDKNSLDLPPANTENCEGKTKLIDSDVPQIPEEFKELQLLKACHPTLFHDQATLLRARFDAFLNVGFNEDQAMQLLLRWGLKANLTDT